MCNYKTKVNEQAKIIMDMQLQLVELKSTIDALESQQKFLTRVMANYEEYVIKDQKQFTQFCKKKQMKAKLEELIEAEKDFSHRFLLKGALVSLENMQLYEMDQYIQK